MSRLMAPEGDERDARGNSVAAYVNQQRMRLDDLTETFEGIVERKEAALQDFAPYLSQLPTELRIIIYQFLSFNDQLNLMLAARFFEEDMKRFLIYDSFSAPTLTFDWHEVSSLFNKIQADWLLAQKENRGVDFREHMRSWNAIYLLKNYKLEIKASDDEKNELFKVYYDTLCRSASSLKITVDHFTHKHLSYTSPSPYVAQSVSFSSWGFFCDFFKFEEDRNGGVVLKSSALDLDLLEKMEFSYLSKNQEQIDRFLVALSALAPHLNGLNSLVLSNMKIKGLEHLKLLAGIIRNLKGLQRLDISGNSLYQYNSENFSINIDQKNYIRDLFDALASKASFCELNLSQINALENPAIAGIFKDFLLKAHLTKLSLNGYGNKLTQFIGGFFEAIRAQIEPESSKRAVVYLSLEGTVIPKDEVLSFNALLENGLETLVLDYGSCVPKGVLRGGEYASSTLKSLAYSAFSPPQNELSSHLLEAFPLFLKNPEFYSLDLPYVMMTPPLFDILVTGLTQENGARLKRLNLKGAQMSDDHIAGLLSILEMQTDLKFLDISYNSFSYEGRCGIFNKLMTLARIPDVRIFQNDRPGSGRSPKLFHRQLKALKGYVSIKS